MWPPRHQLAAACLDLNIVTLDIAMDIGMHESTVSRVTSNKYMHTPQGIFPMKFFFNSRIESAGGGDLASEAVKRKINRRKESF